MDRRFGDDFHQRSAGAVVVDQAVDREVVEFADVLLEVNAREGDGLVFAHDVAGGAGQFDLHAAAEADRLVVLGDLIVLRAVGIEIVLPVPFADGSDRAIEEQADLDDLVQRLLVEHGQRAGQRLHHGVSERVGGRTETGGDTREHLRTRLELDVHLEPDDGLVRGKTRLGHRGHRGRRGHRECR